MKNLFYAALFLFSTFAYGQITFEKGYIIDNNGDKKEVLIKNYEWKKNPVTIEYKFGENENPLQVNTLNLKEFFVGNQKYVTATVMMDRSSNKIESLSTSKNFNYKEETVLLKLLVEGKKSLYQYYDGSIIRFFYKNENENIYNSLNYKEYLVSSNVIQKNEDFKDQLTKEFSDNEKITSKQINNIKYNEDYLEKVFKVYNNINDENVKNKNNFHIYLKPGIGFSQYNIERSQNQLFMFTDQNIQVKYKENTTLYRISAELEYVLNFNKGKWAIVSDLAFQTAKFDVNSDILDTKFEIKYSSLQIPLGVKYNMFLNQKSKIYFSASLYYNMVLNKNTFTTNGSSTTAADTILESFAVGYNYDKFGAEIRLGGVPNFKTYYDGPYHGTYYDYYHNVKMNGLNLSVSYKLF